MQQRRDSLSSMVQPISRCVAIVPARGGSKRLPRKNLRVFGFTPLFLLSVSLAANVEEIDEIVLSSDDPEILDMAKPYREDITIINRPPELASDDASSYDVILHVLDSLDSPYDLVCLLQPTSPLRDITDLRDCINYMIDDPEQPAIVSVSEDNDMVPNGAIYVARTDWLRERLAMGETHPWDGVGLTRYVMPACRSVDIDTQEDWDEAIRIWEADEWRP